MEKKEALAILYRCSSAYQKNLSGKSLLFICRKREKAITSFEAFFLSNNFLHLTGCKTKLEASLFFKRCVSRTLKLDEFWLSEDGTTELKLSVLPAAIGMTSFAKMIGDSKNNRVYLNTEKMVGGEFACLGFSRERLADRYVPVTLLKADIRNETVEYARVLAIYRKMFNEPIYDELIYLAKGISEKQLEIPEGYNVIKQI